MTRAILQAMAQRAKLLSIEINPHLHTLVSRIEDGRLIAHRGDANGLKEILSMCGLGAPEVLISGIPFSAKSLCSGSQILEAISSVLAPGGRFVAYQVSKRVACLCQPILEPGQMDVIRRIGVSIFSAVLPYLVPLWGIIIRLIGYRSNE